MSQIERPRLRTCITGHVDADDPRFVWLYDSARLSRQMIRVSTGAVAVIEAMNGQNTLRDIQSSFMHSAGGALVPLDPLVELVEKLNEALFLDGPRVQAKYDEFRASPIREPACIGPYEGDPHALRMQLSALFEAEGGPGLPNGKPPVNGLRGILIPHIDFQRGGVSYGWSYKALVERSEATTFVVIGTSHFSSHRFTLTRKDFRTPLGVAETNKEYVDQIAAHYGDASFEDEPAHMPEHSIEFQVLLLQFCLKNRRPLKIVPILVGPFQDCVQKGLEPCEEPGIARMIEALRQAEAGCKEEVCYISSGDLAHIGPKFGDVGPLRHPYTEWSRQQDQRFLEQTSIADPHGLSRFIRSEKDQRRICGYPPTYTVLSVLQPNSGETLSYDQFIDPTGHESVSFAGVAFSDR